MPLWWAGPASWGIDMDHEPGMRPHGRSQQHCTEEEPTSSHGVVLGWPQKSALGTRADPGTTWAYSGARGAWLPCAAGTEGLEVQTDVSREAAGSAQAPPCSEACAGAAPLSVLSQLRAANTKAPPSTAQSARVRHKHPSCACLNNLCYLNQKLPVNHQPAWKQGSCDPQ